MAPRLEPGVYEELVTAGLTALIDLRNAEAHLAIVDSAEAPELLADHLAKVATRLLASLPPEHRLDVVNDVLTQLSVATARSTREDLVEVGPKLLLSIGAESLVLKIRFAGPTCSSMPATNRRCTKSWRRSWRRPIRWTCCVRLSNGRACDSSWVRSKPTCVPASPCG